MPMSTIDVKELPQRLAEVLAQVARGSDVILTDGDKPFARMSPMTGGLRIPGLGRGSVAYIAPDFDDPLPDEFWLGEE